jgi:hypothetical protein
VAKTAWRYCGGVSGRDDVTAAGWERRRGVRAGGCSSAAMVEGRGMVEVLMLSSCRGGVSTAGEVRVRGANSAGGATSAWQMWFLVCGIGRSAGSLGTMARGLCAVYPVA